ncbi:MAG: hypothetical protein JNM88_18250 [Chitinophagaceae bacterium]|nr:hypothetical protein [Chitinophagaceae bacterium]
MKKIFRNNRIVAIAFLTMFSVAAAPAAMAGEKNPVVPVQLIFLGHVKNQPLFQLNFNGDENQNDVTIIISDEYGNSLYRENIKAETFSKKFLLNTEELGDETLYFTVFCKNNKKAVEYVVNRSTQTINQVVVNEVK